MRTLIHRGPTSGGHVTSLAERCPNAAELMLKAREDMLAFRHFPEPHWKKVWSTNMLEPVNEEIKRRTRVVGIIPTTRRLHA